MLDSVIGKMPGSVTSEEHIVNPPIVEAAMRLTVEKDHTAQQNEFPCHNGADSCFRMAKSEKQRFSRYKRGKESRTISTLDFAFDCFKLIPEKCSL